MKPFIYIANILMKSFNKIKETKRVELTGKVAEQAIDFRAP